MRFLLDESAEFRIAGYLASEGHDVTAVAHDYPAGLADRQVLEIAQAEQRILITNDRDFGALVFQEGLAHSGVVHFRLGDQEVEMKLAWLARLLADYSTDLMHYVVVTERGVRVRRTGTG